MSSFNWSIYIIWKSRKSNEAHAFSNHCITCSAREAFFLTQLCTNYVIRMKMRSIFYAMWHWHTIRMDQMINSVRFAAETLSSETRPTFASSLQPSAAAAHSHTRKLWSCLSYFSFSQKSNNLHSKRSMSERLPGRPDASARITWHNDHLTIFHQYLFLSDA